MVRNPSRWLTVAGLGLLVACGSNGPTIEEITDEPSGEGAGGTTGGAGGARKADAAAGGSKTEAGAPAPDSGSIRPVSNTPCAAKAGATVTVCNSKTGVSIKYAGADTNSSTTTDGPDLDELGVTVVRNFGITIGDSTPFEGLTKDQVKADPSVIDWNAMESYFGGSHESWLKWAQQKGGIILYTLAYARNKQPSPTCNAGEMTFRVGNANDENLVWVFFFAYAYWGNVKNSLHATHVELYNEPDNCGGNGITQTNQAGVNRMIQIAKDAMTYVNGTLAKPPVPAAIVGPAVLTESDGWVASALSDSATRAALDVVSWHTYWDQHWFQQVQDSAQDVNSRTGGTKKQWITEWGQFWYTQGYSDATVVHGMSAVIPKMGLWNVEVNVPWTLNSYGGMQNGLIQDGTKTRLYRDLKMLYRALLSEKDMLATNLPNRSGDTSFAYATQDAKDLYVIYMNNAPTGGDVVIDVSQLPNADGKAVELSQVSDEADAMTATTKVGGGTFKIKAQGDTHYVAKIVGAGFGG